MTDPALFRVIPSGSEGSRHGQASSGGIRRTPTPGSLVAALLGMTVKWSIALIITAALFSAAPLPAADASRLTGEIDAPGLAAAIAKEKGRVVLVNFWATWCVPCRQEFPDLVKLDKAYRARGLTVIGVSTDLAKDLPAVEKFLAASSPDFANYRKKSGGDDQVFIEAVDEKWGGELPFSVVYGPDGKKAKVLSGKQSYASFEKAIAGLLR